MVATRVTEPGFKMLVVCFSPVSDHLVSPQLGDIRVALAEQALQYFVRVLPEHGRRGLEFQRLA